MAPDFKSYLATQVIGDRQTVSYRNVARALKVHVNAAKCMLYEFYGQQNKKSAGSVYATYLVSGTKAPQDVQPVEKQAQANGDEHIRSTPPPLPSSMPDPSQHGENGAEMPHVPVRTVMLVREEVLESVKQTFEDITSIHMYSISPGRLADLVALTDIDRDLFDNQFVNEDPLKDNKTYGVIQNPDVRRRRGKRPVIPDTAAPKFQPVKDVKKELAKDTKTNTTADATRGTVASKNNSAPSSRDSSVAPQTNKPSLKKDNSNLFKAFAKQQDKPKLNRQDTDQSTNASVSGAEDVKMTDAEEEGESDDEALFLDTNTRKSGTKKRASDIKKERNDKAAKLRKMMEDDEEEAEQQQQEGEADVEKAVEPDKDTDKTEKAQKENDGDEVEWSESDSESKKAEPIEPRKRRGKRKVMKKRTMKDEDGYLVTKEEAVWESYSEDEPESTKDTPKSSFGNTNAQSSQKSSAAGTGDGKKKGNIMSFFGKK